MACGARQQHEAHGKFQIFALHAVAQGERRTGARCEACEEVGPMALYTESHRGGAEFFLLRGSQLDLR